RRRRRAIAQRRVRADRGLQRERGRVDLLEPHGPRLRRVDDDARRAQDERRGIVGGVGPRPPVQERDALRVEAPQVAAAPEARRPFRAACSTRTRAPRSRPEGLRYRSRVTGIVPKSSPFGAAYVIVSSAAASLGSSVEPAGIRALLRRNAITSATSADFSVPG